jgi:hypothetical protein
LLGRDFVSSTIFCPLEFIFTTCFVIS